MTTKHPTAFGARLREIRKSRGITQWRFAHELGISPQALSNIERGKYVSPERAATMIGPSARELIQAAVQDMIDRAGLPYVVRLKKASGS